MTFPPRHRAPGALRITLAIVMIASWIGCGLVHPGKSSLEVGRKLEQEPFIRVQLAEYASVGDVTLRCSQSAAIFPLYGHEKLGEVAAAAGVTITFEHQHLKIGALATKCAAVRLTTASGGEFSLGERRYAGVLEVHGLGGGRLRLILRTRLEDYVAGVVAREMSLSWPAEALAAQAVAARSFAFHKMARTSRAEGESAPFDVVDSTADQAFGGIPPGDDRRGHDAAFATRGEILVAEGAPPLLFKTMYHSTCGGATAPAEAVFGEEFAGVAPLLGASCGYCTASPMYTWKRGFTEKDFRVLAAKAGDFALARVTGARLRSESGEPSHGAFVELDTEDGQKVRVSTPALRRVAGPGRGDAHLPSARFEVFLDGDRVELRGFGWGHGVGMCQWGARGMAQEGRPAREILAHYYPHSRTVTLY